MLCHDWCTLSVFTYSKRLCKFSLLFICNLQSHFLIICTPLRWHTKTTKYSFAVHGFIDNNWLLIEQRVNVKESNLIQYFFRFSLHYINQPHVKKILITTATIIVSRRNSALLCKYLYWVLGSECSFFASNSILN